MIYTCCGYSYDVHLHKTKYSNGRTALQLRGDEGLVATVTVNLPDEKLEEGEIFVKTWSENEPMLEFLKGNKIAEDTGKRVPTGYVEAAVCKLLI